MNRARVGTYCWWKSSTSATPACRSQRSLSSSPAHQTVDYGGRSADSTSAPVRAASSTRPCCVMLREGERQLDPGGTVAGGVLAAASPVPVLLDLMPSMLLNSSQFSGNECKQPCLRHRGPSGRRHTPIRPAGGFFGCEPLISGSRRPSPLPCAISRGPCLPRGGADATVLTTLGSTGPIGEQVGRVVASRAMASRASGAIAPDAQQQGELPMSPDRAKTADQGVPNRVNSRTPSQTARAIHRLQKGRARNHSCTSCGDAGSLVDRAAWNSNRRRGVGDTRGKL
jgi:hypothetical protein